jgi:hypothetical protein
VAEPRPAVIGAMKREVGAALQVEITAPTTLEFQIAVAPHPNTEVSEQLSFVLNGNPIQPSEINGMHGNRIHKIDAPVGNLTVDYAATIVETLRHLTQQIDHPAGAGHDPGHPAQPGMQADFVGFRWAADSSGCSGGSRPGRAS